MTWGRSLIGAVLVGLPTAVLAHALTYGSGHVLGGSHHQDVVQLALALGAVALAATGALALASARTAQTGSILASRLAAYVPGWGTLAVTATGWFAVIESLEAEHALPLLPIAAAIAACAWIFAQVARAAVTAIAQIAFSIFAPPTAPRRIFGLVPQVAPVLAVRRVVDRRRFARPPPFLA